MRAVLCFVNGLSSIYGLGVEKKNRNPATAGDIAVGSDYSKSIKYPHQTNVLITQKKSLELWKHGIALSNKDCDDFVV